MVVAVDIALDNVVVVDDENVDENVDVDIDVWDVWLVRDVARRRGS